MPRICRKWTKEEDEIVKKLYKDMRLSLKDISSHLDGRSPISVKNRAIKLKVKRGNCEDLKDFINTHELNEFYKTHTRKETSEHFELPDGTLKNFLKHIDYDRKCKKALGLPNDIKLTKKQEDIINGTLLGDASLIKPKSNCRNSALKITHYHAQKEYLKKVYDDLFPFFDGGVRDDRNTKIIRKDGVVVGWERKEEIDNYKIISIYHPIFTELEKKWYLRDENGDHVLKPFGPNGMMKRIKIVPSDLELTPLALAIWFFDDGYNRQNGKEITLCTQGFTFDEGEYLISQMNNLGIDHCKIIKCPKDENQPLITITRKSYFDFMDLIEPHSIYECLEYKTEFNADDEVKKKCKLGLSLNNTTGIKNVSFSNKKWHVHISINSKEMFIGSYYDKEIAKEVSNKINNMKDNGVTDIEEYKKIKKQYKFPEIDNTSGCTGVSYNKMRSKFSSYIQFNKMKISLGNYKNKEDAINIRKQSENLFDNGITEKEEYLKLKKEFQKSLQEV